MTQDEINNLQARVADAINQELPPGWTYMAGLTSPDGQIYMQGTVKGTSRGAEFLEALSEKLKIQVWRVPPKRMPVRKVRTTGPILLGASSFTAQNSETIIEDAEPKLKAPTEAREITEGS